MNYENAYFLADIVGSFQIFGKLSMLYFSFQAPFSWTLSCKVLQCTHSFLDDLIKLFVPQRQAYKRLIETSAVQHLLKGPLIVMQAQDRGSVTFNLVSTRCYMRQERIMKDGVWPRQAKGGWFGCKYTGRETREAQGNAQFCCCSVCDLEVLLYHSLHIFCKCTVGFDDLSGLADLTGCEC